MSHAAYDCVVVGAGPGGYVAAIRAAQLGLRTAVVERGPVGGRCLHEACIPAKAVLRSADVASEVRGATDLGISVSGIAVDFEAIARRRGKVIETLASGVAGLLRKHGVEVVRGQARLVGEGTVEVGDRSLSSPALILATGSVRRPLPGIPFGGRVIGTEEIWAAADLPESLAVVGAGASGAEIASAYARLGSRVELFEVADRVLPIEDADVSRVVQRAFEADGIHVHLGTAIDDVEATADDVRVSAGGVERRFHHLVVAAGRGPDVVGLGLDELGVRLTAGGLVEVDEAQRTSVPGIYAIGDIVPGPALAHKASEEGIVAAEAAAGRPVHPVRREEIPRATFCRPNVGSFGLTEQQAVERGHDVVVGRVPYGAVGASTVYGDVAGLVKIVGDRTDGSIVGAHVVGMRATELVQQVVDVVGAEGGYEDLARVVHGHPTLSELVVEAARAADGWLIHG